ncbi:MAG: FecR domain-containing protein [Reyranella sp.]|nr:FecR domain-containing protein [Reyranella sp.]
MGQQFRRGVATVAIGIVSTVLICSSAWAQTEPPGRVGRLAFTNGTVSFHDNQQSSWIPAAVNTPITSGNALWTEPNARSEVSLAGTRIRMEGGTELDVLALDDSQTRLQLPQGRIDVKSVAMDANQPYEIATPRGTIKLLQQGDYYVEAGSTEDPTRLGVRAGAAQIQGLNGKVLAVRPNEVAEVTGDGSTLQLRTIQSAPPAPPAYWANRDRQVVYDPPQYLSAGMTGYEDLNGYGDWINDGSYGRVWVPRAVPTGWAPYRTGHWAYVDPWGWTWIDDQPWGFAPYHYGRWANRNNRWLWVPPQPDVQPVYAPALVAFVGGAELAVTLGNRSAAPVGWFPLGPREAYVPPYTTNRDYYQRLNRSARVEDRILEDRWQHAERREAFVAGQNSVLMNQRFATVVPTSAFVQSQPVMRSALRVQPQALAAAPVAPVAAPPAPTASIRSAAAPAPATPPAPADPKVANVPVAKTAIADMPTLARPPATTAPVAAPGPKFAATQPNAATDDKSKQQALPALAPRQGVAPPQLKGAVTPASAQPPQPGTRPQAAPQPHAAPPIPAPQSRPGPNKPADSSTPQAAPQPAPTPQQHAPQAAPAPAAKPIEPPRQQAAPPPPSPQAQPPRPQAPPPTPRPTQQQEGHAAPPPQYQPAPQQQAAPQQHQAAPPPPQHQAAPQPQPQPQHQAAPQPQQQHQAQPPQQAQAPQPKKDDKK